MRHTLLKVQDSGERWARQSPNSALRWPAERAGATRPPVKVGRIPDSWLSFCLCVSAALSRVSVSPILACGGLMTQFVWKKKTATCENRI